MILKPNETAIYRKSTGILSMHINANAQNEISWREGVLSFNDISMGEIARQLSHHFNVTIQIKSEQLRNYKLNARFKQNENVGRNSRNVGSHRRFYLSHAPIQSY